MAAPNILAATSIIGKSAGFDLDTTTTTTLLTCAAEKVYKIKSIIASNNDGTSAAVSYTHLTLPTSDLV